MLEALDHARRAIARRLRRLVPPSPVTDPRLRIIPPHRLPLLNMADGTAQRDSVTGGVYRDDVDSGGARRYAWGTVDPACCCLGKHGSGSGSGTGYTCGCLTTGGLIGPGTYGNLTVTVSGSFSGGVGCYNTSTLGGGGNSQATIYAPVYVSDASISGTVCAKMYTPCAWKGHLNVFNATQYLAICNGCSCLTDNLGAKCPTGSFPCPDPGCLAGPSACTAFHMSGGVDIFLNPWYSPTDGNTYLRIFGYFVLQDCHFNGPGVEIAGRLYTYNDIFGYTASGLMIPCGGSATYTIDTTALGLMPYTCGDYTNPYHFSGTITVSDAGCT